MGGSGRSGTSNAWRKAGVLRYRISNGTVVLGLRLALTIALLACSKETTAPTATAQMAITGRAEIRGLIADSAGLGLDSVVVSIGTGFDSVLIQPSTDTTRSNGAFVVAVVRLLFGAGVDSALISLGAWSIRARDRATNGTPLSLRRNVWVHLSLPPDEPRRVPFSATLPTAR